MTSNNKIIVRNAIFERFSKIGSGGVFEFSDKSIEIKCSSFSFNTVDKEGGCFFGSNCNLTLLRTYFHNCYSSGSGCGNAIFMKTYESMIKDISTLFCAPEPLGIDSCIRIENSKVSVNSMNSTKNSGSGGCSAISLLSCLSGTVVKFLNECDGTDDYSIESSNKYNVYNSNFINGTNHDIICWTSANDVIAFESCVFWNIGASKTAIAKHRCSCNNCISDSQLASISQVSSYSVNIIRVRLACNKKSAYNLHNCMNSKNYLLFVIVLAIRA